MSHPTPPTSSSPSAHRAAARERMSTLCMINYKIFILYNARRVKYDFGAMANESGARFTVSLSGALMATLDRLRATRGYTNRSEFVRDLLRAELVKEEWEAQRGQTVGVLALVYDHHTRALADKLIDIQHQHFRTVVGSLHVHLDAHNCLEVITLRGTPRRIRRAAHQLLALKGVRYGQLVPATAGKRLS